MKRRLFADRMGIPYDRLANYLLGRTEPPLGFWINLKASFPEASIEELITGTSSEGRIFDVSELHGQKVPIVHNVHAGPLTLGIADEQVIGWTWSSNMNDKDLFALEVKGASMAPQIDDGDLVICAPRRPFIQGKLYVVVMKSSEATIKRVFRRPGRYELVPVNPEFESRIVDEEDVIRLDRVVEVQKKEL